MCELKVARATLAGRGSRIRKGAVVCADDPIVAGREKLFEPLRITHHCKQRKGDAMVEQATAAPGEKRAVKLPNGGGRPPTSGPGSGVDAWRVYAAKATGMPAEDFATMSRDDVIELLDSGGA